MDTRNDLIPAYVQQKDAMPYSLSNKQLDRLSKGEPLSVALPPHPAHFFGGDQLHCRDLTQWAASQFTGLGRATVPSASLTDVWLDCEPDCDGMTGVYGAIIPDIEKYSPNGLPAIPVSVVVCEIVPPGYVGELADRIQWPGSYVSPTGYKFGGKQ